MCSDGHARDLPQFDALGENRLFIFESEFKLAGSAAAGTDVWQTNIMHAQLRSTDEQVQCETELLENIIESMCKILNESWTTV